MASLTAVIICCLLIIVLVSSQEEEECSSADNNIEKIRLGLEWFTNPDHLPLIVAQKHGIFKTFGLDVELVEPVDHWEAEEEILAGRLDVRILFGSIGMLKWLLFTDSISYDVHNNNIISLHHSQQVAVTEPLHLAQDAAKGKPVIG